MTDLPTQQRLAAIVDDLYGWTNDLGRCRYYQRGRLEADPDGTCGFGCYDEPECQTGRPKEGWLVDQIPELDAVLNHAAALAVDPEQ